MTNVLTLPVALLVRFQNFETVEDLATAIHIASEVASLVSCKEISNILNWLLLLEKSRFYLMQKRTYHELTSCDF